MSKTGVYDGSQSLYEGTAAVRPVLEVCPAGVAVCGREDEEVGR